MKSDNEYAHKNDWSSCRQWLADNYRKSSSLSPLSTRSITKTYRFIIYCLNLNHNQVNSGFNYSLVVRIQYTGIPLKSATKYQLVISGTLENFYLSSLAIFLQICTHLMEGNRDIYLDCFQTRRFTFRHIQYTETENERIAKLTEIWPVTEFS